jgi:hypothetical protein
MPCSGSWPCRVLRRSSATPSYPRPERRCEDARAARLRRPHDLIARFAGAETGLRTCVEASGSAWCCLRPPGLRLQRAPAYGLAPASPLLAQPWSAAARGRHQPVQVARALQSAVAAAWLRQLLARRWPSRPCAAPRRGST